MNKDSLWKKIHISGILSFVFPVLLLICGIVLSKNGFIGMVENYDEGLARFIQYGLFAIGVIIFFSCDVISNFFSRRIFIKKNKEPFTSYMLYVLSTLWLFNIISITGFTGFLISGNITWLTIFVILNLAIGIKYLPSHKRMEKLIEGTKT